MEVLLTGLFTLIAGLGGVALTQRHERERARETRAEARRNEQRRVLGNLLIAGYEKVDMYLVLLPALAKFTEKDQEEFVKTDTGRRLGEINAEMSRALAEARLLVGDQPLKDHLDQLRAYEVTFSDIAVGNALRSGRPAASPEDLYTSIGHVVAMRKVLNTLEAAAINLLQAPVKLDDIETAARRFRWSSLKFWGRRA